MRRSPPPSGPARPARRWRRLPGVPLALVLAVLAARADAAGGVLRVTPAPSPPGDAAAVAREPAVQLCGLAYEPADPLPLDGVRAAGWTAGSSTSGRPGCLLAASGAAPLEIPLAADRDRVALRFERSPGGGAAIVELAGRTRLVELVGEGSAEVELGSGAAQHAWREPRTVPYERSLVRDAGFVAAGGAPFAARLALDRPHGLDPHPILPSAVTALPLEVTYPEVFVPADGAVELGIALAGAAAPLSVRIEARFVPLHDGPERAHAVTVLAGSAVQHASVLLGGRAEGAGRLTLRISSADPARAGERVEIVDPLVRGVASVVARRPNVIVVTLDTVRADHLSLYGYHRPTTPFLASLASHARVFDAAYAQITNTRPSHFSLFTGRYSGDIGIWNNDGPPLPERELTLAEVLRSAGWRTGAVTSVGFLGPASGLGQGFEEMHVPRPGQHPLGAETTRTALDFVRRHAGEPFFLWAHYFDAHLPYQPVPELRGLFWQGPPPSEESVDRTLIPPDFFDGLFVLPHVQYMTAMYDASLRYLDDQMRALFATLESVGLLDETIVVVAADHGESLGEHGIFFVHAGLYETTVHVPLLIHAPRALARPGRVAQVVENLDIPATVFALTGLEQPASFRGTSLMRDEPGDGVAFFEHYGRFATGMRRGAIKTIDARELKNHRDRVWPSLRLWYEAPSLQMFDVARDPAEEHDLAPAQSEAMHESLAILDAWRADRAHRAPIAGRVDPKLTESLRALGYAE